MATRTTADKLSHTINPDIESSSDAYASRFAGGVGEFLLKRQEDIVRSHVTEYSHGSLAVLDVGGGHGQLTPLFLKAQHKLTVFGSSSESHNRLRTLYPSDSRIEYAEGDLYQLPFPDGAFDIVTAFRLVPHLTEPALFIGELARVARKEVIFDFAPQEGLNSLTPLLFGVKKKIEGNTRLYFTHRSSQIREILQPLGFDEVSITKQFALPMGLHRLLKSPGMSSALERTCAAVGLTALLGAPAIAAAKRTESGV